MTFHFSHIPFAISIPLYFLCHFSSAQPVAISGRVLDGETHRPLMAASVVMLGTEIGSSTDENGEYVLHVGSLRRHQIQVRYVGYEAQVRNVEIHTFDVRLPDFELQSMVLPGQTIVVTATRGRERETPAAFSTLEAEEIAKTYLTQDIPQMLAGLPSTTWYSENGNGIGYTYLNIRGFDQRRISVMINGIPQNDPEDHNVYWLDFPDLLASTQDIQVQRGAGSAFYGPPSIGGSVNIITAAAPLMQSVSASYGFGSYRTKKISVAASSGLVGSRYVFSGRLARITSDGYRVRSWARFTGFSLTAARFDEEMTTQVNVYGGPITDHLAYYGLPKASAYSSNESVRRANPILREEEIEEFSQPHYEFLHEWRVSNRVTVNNAVFAVTGKGYFDYDGSWAPYSYFRITPSFGFAVSGDPDTLYIPQALIRAYVDNRQYGWLPRIQWEHESGELTVGAELRIHRSLHWGAVRSGEKIPSGAGADRHYYEYRGGKNIASFYAQESYSISPDVTGQLGLQYAFSEYQLFDERYLGTSFSMPYHFVNPRIGVNFNASEAVNMFVQIAHTTREPRLKNLYDAAEASTPVSWGSVSPQFEVTGTGAFDFRRPLVKPERLFSFESGIGVRLDHSKISLNAYWMDFRDEIVRQGKLDRFGQPITGNAGQTLHAGIECSASSEIGNGVAASGNVTVSRNRIIRSMDYSEGSPRSLDGNAIAGFPDVLGNFRITYEASDISGGISAQYVGDFYTDNRQNPDVGRVVAERRVDARTTCDLWSNLRIRLNSEETTLELQIQVRNFFDVTYAAHGDGDHFYPAAKRNVIASLRLNM